MGLELPGYVTEPLSWIGMTWPEADEDKLFESGQTWLNYGASLRTQAQQANSIAQKIPSEHEGEAVDQFTPVVERRRRAGQESGRERGTPPS